MNSEFDYTKTYYKVTNEYENHNGYQYKDGLNILNEKFIDDPEASCVSGGFYFTDYNHLPKFFEYGIWIREVTIPTDAKVVLDPEGNKWRCDKIIFGNKYHIKNDFEKGLAKLAKVDKTGELIYKTGLYWKKFDFEKGMDILAKVDKTGEWIFYAGMYWEKFDFKKGLEKLAKVDKTGEWIYNAGKYWKRFDFEKGLEKLTKVDKTGKWIFYAGMYWEKFDFKKGLEKLAEVDNTGKWIRNASMDWNKKLANAK